MSAFEDWLCRAREAKRLALIAHVSPDGDTLGATLALRLAFLSLGKAVDVICDGVVPRNLNFIPGVESILSPEQAQGNYDVAAAVDISGRDRMGKSEAIFDAAQVRLVVDHHKTNTRFGDVNFVREGESATCLLAYEIIVALGVTITREMATCLMTGMSTDTGHFQYTATSPQTLIAAGELLKTGVDISLMTRRLYRTQSMERVRLARRVYEKLYFALDDQVGVVKLTRRDFEETGSTADEADGFVNRALEVEGVRMAVLASERDDGVKMSLRAVEPDSVAPIAVTFGGGGHAQAAGCLIDRPIDEATEMILSEMKKLLGPRA